MWGKESKDICTWGKEMGKGSGLLQRECMLGKNEVGKGTVCWGEGCVGRGMVQGRGREGGRSLSKSFVLRAFLSIF